jgi:hypothetical protein
LRGVTGAYRVHATIVRPPHPPPCQHAKSTVPKRRQASCALLPSLIRGRFMGFGFLFGNKGKQIMHHRAANGTENEFDHRAFWCLFRILSWDGRALALDLRGV